MKKTMNRILLTGGLLLALCACQKLGNSTDPNTIQFRFHHPSAATKATDTGFEEGDRAGVFMVYSGETVGIRFNWNENSIKRFRPVFLENNRRFCVIVALIKGEK